MAAHILDHHTFEVMRQQVGKAVHEDQTGPSVATPFGVDQRSVFRWFAGFAKPLPGRPPKLNHEEKVWIAKTVLENTPQQFGFEFGLWTLSLIRHLIKRQFSKDLSIATVSRLMKRFDFSAQKPLYQMRRQNLARARSWKRQTYPAIRAEAEALDATIYFADELSLRSDYHSATIWALRGQRPVVETIGPHFSLNMLSAVSPHGKFHFMLHEGSMGAAVFREFLSRLMIGADKSVFVIVDGRPNHKAKLIKTYVEQLNGKLQLFYLPPYSPRLNPDQGICACVKQEVGKQIVLGENDLQ